MSVNKPTNCHVVKKHTIQGLGLSLLVCQTNICHTGTPISPRSWDQVSSSVKKPQEIVIQALPYHPGVGTKSPCLSNKHLSHRHSHITQELGPSLLVCQGTKSPCLSKNQMTYMHSHITQGLGLCLLVCQETSRHTGTPTSPRVGIKFPCLSRNQPSYKHSHITQGLRPSLLFCQETSCHAGTPIPPRG